MSLEKQITLLKPLCEALKRAKTLEERRALLLNFTGADPRRVPIAEVEQEVAYLAVCAVGQKENVFREPSAVHALVKQLAPIERHYQALGGLVGYHMTFLEKLLEAKESRQPSPEPPEEIPLSRAFIESGLRVLPEMGEMYPVGGLGSRLNLQDSSGAPLPAALLPFCGRTLLEGLIRDLEGRERLYEALFGKKMITPIALMTAEEQGNHAHIEALLKRHRWFGRPRESFRLFTQLSVPVITCEGHWSMSSPKTLNLHPGGHGALWRMAEEQGVFSWFERQGRKKLLVRQINNPLAGLDATLLSFIGYGVGKPFGLIACERLPKAAEGVLVRRGGRLAAIEYSDFSRLGIDPGAPYPANTNILYVDIARVRPYLAATPFPGLIVNAKNRVPLLTAQGNVREARGGRLESLMQSIVENIPAAFIIHHERRMTLSVAKRAHERGKPLLETPEGAFRDLMKNARELLALCHFRVHPTARFLYHAALGPLYDVIAQKLRGGSLGQGAEVALDIAELDVEELEVEGCLRVRAEGLKGRCSLERVQVRGGLEIYLLGNSEFHAEEVAFEGPCRYVVPDGHRCVVSAAGVEQEKIDTPTWQWKYSLSPEGVRVWKQICCNTDSKK